jgi:glycerophosphoryl diester phosphodiesterase
MKPCHVLFVVLVCLPGLGLAQEIASPPAGLHTVAPATAEDLQNLLRYTGEPLPLVSAHRGGSGAGYPENCIATFEHTLRHGYAMMEVDPRTTKDGVIVLHHDATLDRTTTGSGPLAQRTLAELKQLRLKDSAGKATEFQIPTLAEALVWSRGKTVLVLDQKDVPVAARVRTIQQHAAEAHAMLIVYSFADAQECYRLNPRIMMEVMIPTREKLRQFEQTGVPWRNVIAFVGHDPPRDEQLLAMLHDKGVLCLAGTSRNLDRELAAAPAADRESIESKYRRLIRLGVDVVETDLPREVGSLLHEETGVPPAKAEMLKR